MTCWSSRTFPGQSYRWSSLHVRQRQPRPRPADLAGGEGQEVISEERDVLLAFAEGRQFDREHTQPVVQVLAEPAGLGLRPEIAVRRRDQPHVHPRVRSSPTRSSSPSWRTRSSLAWSSSGISPISSRNSVPPSASSNRPARSRTAPVNAPLACPKNSLSYRSRGHRRAVHLDQRLGRPLAPPVDLAGDQFLAGPALAQDQDRRIRSGRRGRSAARRPPGPGPGRSARRRPRPRVTSSRRYSFSSSSRLRSASISSNARAAAMARGGVVGDHPQPAHAIAADAAASEHGQHAEHLAPV